MKLHALSLFPWAKSRTCVCTSWVSSYSLEEEEAVYRPWALRRGLPSLLKHISAQHEWPAQHYHSIMGAQILGAFEPVGDVRLLSSIRPAAWDLELMIRSVC